MNAGPHRDPRDAEIHDLRRRVTTLEEEAMQREETDETAVSSGTTQRSADRRSVGHLQVQIHRADAGRMEVEETFVRSRPLRDRAPHPLVAIFCFLVLYAIVRFVMIAG